MDINKIMKEFEERIFKNWKMVIPSVAIHSLKANIEQYVNQKQIEALREMRVDKGLSMEQELSYDEEKFNEKIKNKITELQKEK